MIQKVILVAWYLGIFGLGKDKFYHRQNAQKKIANTQIFKINK